MNDRKVLAKVRVWSGVSSGEYRPELPKTFDSLRGELADHQVAMTIDVRIPVREGRVRVTVIAVTGDVGLCWELAPTGSAEPYPPLPLEVYSLDGGPIGQRLLSRIGLGQVQRALDLALASDWASEWLGKGWGAGAAPRPGRRGRDDLFYAMAALEYVHALVVMPKAPVRYLVDRIGEGGVHVTADELRARLRRARERGLLTDAPKGKPGGELTEKAIALLRPVFEYGTSVRAPQQWAPELMAFLGWTRRSDGDG